MTPLDFDERMGWRKLPKPVTEVPGWTTHWWINRWQEERRVYGIFAVSKKRYRKGRRFVTIRTNYELVADKAVDTGLYLAWRFNLDAEVNL